MGQCQAGCDCRGRPESALGPARRCHLELPGLASSMTTLGWGLPGPRLCLRQVPHLFPPVSGSSHPSHLGAGVSSRLPFCISLVAWSSLASLQLKLPQTDTQEQPQSQCQAREVRGQEQGFASDKMASRSPQWCKTLSDPAALCHPVLVAPAPRKHFILPWSLTGQEVPPTEMES